MKMIFLFSSRVHDLEMRRQLQDAHTYLAYTIYRIQYTYIISYHAIGGRGAVAPEQGSIYLHIIAQYRLDLVSILSCSVYQERLQELQVDQKAGRVQQDEALGEMGPYSLGGGRPRKTWSCAFRTEGHWMPQKFLMCFVGKHDGDLAVFDLSRN